jgi:hypothetical protein
MTASYLNRYLMPRYAVSPQKKLWLSPGDGLKGLQSSPSW